MRQLLVVVATVIALGLVGTRRAEAYPQFQLAKDQTCTGCHISPSGGGLLTENGLNTAGAISTWGTAPEFFYNKLSLPGWLDLGGDLRGTGGYFQTPFRTLSAFPMQADVYGSGHYKGFRLYITAGYRPVEKGNEAATHVWSREHYLLWQEDEGAATGLFVRVGRFMPVFGLRFAEHPDYTRRFGGTALYTETYGAAVEYIAADFEVHATGFVADPLIDSVDVASGAALYAEYRPSEHAAVGAEAMLQRTDDDKRYRGGLTGKLYLPAAEVLVQAEVQLVDQIVKAGGKAKQLVGYLLASRELGAGLALDVGLGHYDENLAVKNLDRDALDLNLHWYTTSHLELIWNNRLEMIGFGSGGPTGAYSLIQLHYRL